MNNVQLLINRQLGTYVDNTYDTAIKRLYCSKTTDFKSFEDTSTEGPPVFACKYAPEQSGYETLLALANEDGKICIQNTSIEAAAATKSDNRYIVNAHHNAIFDLAWMPNTLKLISVSGDHTARLFSVTPTALIEERIFHGHYRSVKTVACRRNDPAVFATGSRDGAIFVWDSRANPTQSYVQKPDRIISNPHSVNDTPTRFKFRKRMRDFIHVPGTESVTGLAFQDDVSLISCGAGDGHIKIWDLRYYSHRKNPQPKYILPYSGGMSHKGFSNLCVDKSGIKLYASCMDHHIYCYNISTYQPEPLMKYSGHQQSTFYVKSCLSFDDQYLISGSGDNHCYIWNIKYESPIVRLEGHIHEVTSVAWSRTQNIELVTCSDDLHHKIWRINPNDAENCGFATETRKRKIQQEKENTPKSNKKQTLVCERCQMRTPGSKDPIINCENCLFGGRSRNKRSALQAHLSTPETSTSSKRFQSGARSRLFIETSAGNSEILASILEENSPDKPSLTENLPNFVVDGQAPHLKNYSPQKKKDKDWLTKIRIEQSLRSQMEDLNSISPKMNSPSNSGNKKCSKRLTMMGHGHGHGHGHEIGTKSPLLKYFTSNSTK